MNVFEAMRETDAVRKTKTKAFVTRARTAIVKAIKDGSYETECEATAGVNILEAAYALRADGFKVACSTNKLFVSWKD